MDARQIRDESAFADALLQRRGQIEVRGGHRQLVQWLAGCCVSTAGRVLIPVARRRTARKLQRDLEQVLREPVGLMTQGQMDEQCWTVCTYGHMHSRWSLVLLPEPASAMADLPYTDLRYLRHGGADLYAFVPVGARLDIQTRERLDELAGPVICRLERPGSHMQVGWASVHTSGVRRSEPEAWRRRAIHHNRPRNHLIARLARALAAQDGPVLLELGLDAGLVEAVKAEMMAPTTVVLVDGTEHLRQLRRLLPGAPCLSLAPTRDGRAPRTVAEAELYGGPWVITTAYCYRHRVPAEILIRASGGRAPLELMGFPPAPPGLLVLVDLADQGDERLEADARARRRLYREVGWEAVEPEWRRSSSALAGFPAKSRRRGVGTIMLERWWQRLRTTPERPAAAPPAAASQRSERHARRGTAGDEDT